VNWREHAANERVENLYVLLEVQKEWPYNDQRRRPRRTIDLDLLETADGPYHDLGDEGPRRIADAIARVVAKDLTGGDAA
jgi:hypothetical protein